MRAGVAHVGAGRSVPDGSVDVKVSALSITPLFSP
jgi:hypothetical protein